MFMYNLKCYCVNVLVRVADYKQNGRNEKQYVSIAPSVSLAAELTETATVNRGRHIDIPRHLRDAARRKRPENWRQCSGTPVGLGLGFISKEQCDENGAPPYSPDLAPPDFFNCSLD